LLSKESDCPSSLLRISDVPTQFSLSGPLAAGLGLAYVSARIITGQTLFRREAYLAFFFFLRGYLLLSSCLSA
jgi:hypothetical protein